MEKQQKATVIFDGDCGICTALAQWAQRLDGGAKLTVLPYQWADLEAISPGLTPEMCSRSVYLVRADGRRFKEGRAAFETLRRLPGWWHVAGWLLANPLFAVLAWPGYRLVAANRARLSVLLGLTACAAPAPKAEAR